MSMRNSRELRGERREARAGARSEERGARCGGHLISALKRRRPARRGVLLLVVLSLLVLFMLIGTAFLMSSNQYRGAAKASAKLNRVGNYPTKLLDRAVLQVLRDTDNPHSAIRYHSLLRDMYGTDGFEAVVYSPVVGSVFNPAQPAQQVTRFAGATGGATPAEQLGPTQGQLIDIYVRELAFRADDPLTGTNEAAGPTAITIPDARHVLKLERSAIDQPEMHTLPLTKGYYNGCLLTITSGPAAGESTRIVDYEYIADINPAAAGVVPAPFAQKSATRLFRFRVMAFSRADGTPLQIDSTRVPEIGDLAGATFIVNGRPFNGTGVGYNPLAGAGEPRLTARERIGIDTIPNALYPEIALTPNSAYFVPTMVSTTNPSITDATTLFGVFHNLVPNPSGPTDYIALNSVVVMPPDRPSLWKYATFPGPGDTDESYDAADFQNMFLALQSVTPRAQGRVVHTGDTYDVDFQNDVDGQPAFNSPANFLRLDLEDLPMPSFHRPDLVNFWFHRLFSSTWLSNEITNEDDRVRAILQPYQPDGSLSPWVPRQQIAGQIVALKRMINMRPLREDHPHFDGSNPQSRAMPTPVLQGLGSLVLSGNQIAIPYWEAMGPWDVDNDNDGVRDSVWVDVGEPISQAEDGTLYKPLVAYLIVDLDGRLNVNAHGLAEDMSRDAVNATMPPELDLTGGLPGNLAHDVTIPPTNTLSSSNQLPHGSGYGPAEISLRPILSPTLPGLVASGAVPAANVGNPGFANLLNADDYARLLIGRPASNLANSVWGRQGSVDVWAGTALNVRPGITYDNVNTPNVVERMADPLPTLEMFGHPGWLSEVYNPNVAFRVPTAFGSPPDLMARYAVGIDYAGQPVYEQASDFTIRYTSGGSDLSLLVDSPYELNLSDPVRREAPDSARINSMAGGAVDFDDDAPFATAELERILRAYDADVGALPDRLWTVVDAFDPLKLRDNQPLVVQEVARQLFNDPSISAANSGDAPQILAAAQQLSAVNRRLVTTDSYDLPVASGSIPNQVAVSLGADGAPGRAGVDDDGVNGTDDAGELNAAGSDDFRALVGKEVAQATIFDLLRIRAWLEVRKQVMAENSYTEAGLAGLNAGNYATFMQEVAIRTEVRLSGEPFHGDTNNNGRVESGEYTELNGNNVYDPPTLDLFAPEVIAGMKMDLNRPFGDGRDSGDGFDNDGNGAIDEPAESPALGGPDLFLNGIVDEPLEAGDPFLDVNGNGKWDSGEPYLDVLPGDNSPPGTPYAGENYDGPRDQLWPELGPNGSGALAEPISFDYTNGATAIIRRDGFGGAGSLPIVGGVRNLESQGRQLYARHLYCLMLLLVGDDYLVPVDLNDPQTDMYLDTSIAGSLAANVRAAVATDAEARRILLRKLTCRKIAQWAINCVDARDADAIMTPFEYDENPWDGWGCMSDAGSRGGGRVNTQLDGDVVTDENLGVIIDWSATGDGGPKAITTATNAPNTLDQTRGVVWGAERPELLITETMAFHDRRATDDALTPSIHRVIDRFDPSNPDSQDKNLDQRLKPQGSLFVELYNPWSADGSLPAEIYRYRGGAIHAVPSTNPPQPYVNVRTGKAAEGVLLQRLSDVAAGGTDRSPVWRLAIVNQATLSIPNNAKYHDYDVAVADGLNGTVARATGAGSIQFHMLNPDSLDFDSNLDAERWVYFAADPSVTGMPPLRIPKAPVDGNRIPTGKRYFLASNAMDPNTDPATTLAPILPGHYGVVGSAGTQYKRNELVDTYPRFVTTLGRIRLPSSGGTQNSDRNHVNALQRTRRIELIPRRDPNYNQLLVEQNGGPEFIAVSGNMVNVTDEDGDGLPDVPTPNRNVKPCVAIPIAGLNITEPVEGYINGFQGPGGTFTDQRGQPRRAYRQLYPDTETRRLLENPTTGELEFVNNQFTPFPFEVPVDMDLDLCRNGTTANYRTIHLQRLANPMLPWNPPPAAAGAPPSEYDPTLPVNPYLTVDSAGTDMTAFNGATELERTDLPTESATRAPQPIGNPALIGASLQGSDDPAGSQRALYSQGEWHNIKRFLPFDGRSGGTQNRNGQFKQKLHLKSLERGYHTQDQIASNATVNRTPRALWAEERANVKQPVGLPVAPGAVPGENPTGGDLVDVFSNDERMRHLQADGVQQSDLDEMLPRDEHVVDFVMEHSLGFQNRLGFGFANTLVPPIPYKVSAAGEFYSGNDAAVPPAEYGTPKINSNNTEQTDDSTYPWLTYNNRPFVSSAELLQIPATSSALMLHDFTTVNNSDLQGLATVGGGPQFVNPYGNDGLDGTMTSPYRAAFPFGHLLSFFATWTQRVDDSGNPLAPSNFYRLLDYVQVPSRFVGTETLLAAEVFNDVPGVDDASNQVGTAVGSNITSPLDPRYKLQPPFNRVSRERDPGRVNINTIVGRRVADPTGSNPPQIWSEVYDGIMHSYQDRNPTSTQLAQFGPAWRDVVLSRRGYAQEDAQGNSVDKPGAFAAPDVLAFGLNSGMPTVFANPFRSSDTGFLVPLPQMQQWGVDTTLLRVHPRMRGKNNMDDDGNGVFDDEPDELHWGAYNVDDDGNGLIDDMREAGFDQDRISNRGPNESRAIPEQEFGDDDRESVPLFSESATMPGVDADRNPAMRYQPMTRLGNLVTTRSNVYAVWVTVGYFEVEPAPDWNDPVMSVKQAIRERFGGTTTDTDAATVAARALYDRVYPDGYMLGQELGSDTGNTKRQRAFYIIDRTQPVGFKPGQDLNVENAIRVRRRIE